jgi:hypothetical protein
VKQSQILANREITFKHANPPDTPVPDNAKHPLAGAFNEKLN